MALTLRQIAFQADLVSKPVRDNFTDIENFVNDLQDQIDGLTTPPAGSEVTDARDYHSVLRDRLRSASKLKGKYMVSGGAVAQDTGTNMKVTVALGEAVVAGVACKWTAATSGTITAPATNPRWDTVVVNSDSTISIISGSEAASYPDLPSPSSTQKKLAHIYLTPGMTQIVNADITDARPEPVTDDYIYGLVPVGSIQAWHKSFTGVPSIPTGWKECDGTAITDPESPMYGETAPNINGEGRHLEGASTSGTSYGSRNAQHNHGVTDAGHSHSITDAGHSHYLITEVTGGGSTLSLVATVGTSTALTTQTVLSTAGTATGITVNGTATGLTVNNDGTADTASATGARPKSFTVVWIMRIK